MINYFVFGLMTTPLASDGDHLGENILRGVTTL